MNACIEFIPISDALNAPKSISVLATEPLDLYCKRYVNNPSLMHMQKIQSSPMWIKAIKRRNIRSMVYSFTDIIPPHFNNF